MHDKPQREREREREFVCMQEKAMSVCDTNGRILRAREIQRANGREKGRVEETMCERELWIHKMDKILNEDQKKLNTTKNKIRKKTSLYIKKKDRHTHTQRKEMRKMKISTNKYEFLYIAKKKCLWMEFEISGNVTERYWRIKKIEQTLQKKNNK